MTSLSEQDRTRIRDLKAKAANLPVTLSAPANLERFTTIIGDVSAFYVRDHRPSGVVEVLALHAVGERRLISDDEIETIADEFGLGTKSAWTHFSRAITGKQSTVIQRAAAAQAALAVAS